MNNLAKKLLGSAGLQVVNKAVVLLTGVLLARMLGPEGYGYYGFIMSIMALMTIPSIAGLPTLLIRETSKYINENKWEYINGLERWSLIYSLFSTVLLGVVIVNLNWSDLNVSDYFHIILPVVIFKVMIKRNSSIINGLNRPVLSIVIELVVFSSLFCVMLLFCYFYLDSFYLEHAIKSYFIASLLCMALSFLGVNSAKGYVKVKNKKYEVRRWFVALLPFSLITILTTLNNEVATVVIGMVGEAKEIGFFKIAVQSGTIISLLLVSINTVIAPTIVKEYSSGDLKQCRELLRKVVRISSALSIPVIFLLLLFSMEIVSFVFGSDFLEAGKYIKILAVGQFINVLCGSSALVLNMTGNEKETLNIFFISFLLTIIVLFVFVNLIGSLGVVIAVSFSMAITNIISCVRCYRVTGLKTWFH